MANIFQLPSPLPDRELLEPLATGNDTLVERIVSSGQTTPSGQWYDQNRDEWVVLLQGEAVLSYEDGSQVTLKRGDYLLIPARTKHRVEYTSAEPPCIWLAVHGNF
ncbi:MAG: cupin domain-containing protein [Cyanobacteria bacterium SID2]|nr:cupin domain-containing protein [Cyanobacteria bacterium SID2]MBP0003324.1 cupin domain-containing protein [Cyanobacteria bacterium SBC]